PVVKLSVVDDRLTAVGSDIIDLNPRRWTWDEGARTWRLSQLPAALDGTARRPMVVRAMASDPDGNGGLTAVGQQQGGAVVVELEQG
ncbi:MAG: hypothetical protein ACRDU8_04370, partial [Egibacteraceae bacterium]